MPTGAAAYYRKRPIRLKPGFLSGDIWIQHSNFISRDSYPTMFGFNVQSSSARPEFYSAEVGFLLLNGIRTHYGVSLPGKSISE
jgi:hypothetical protein